MRQRTISRSIISFYLLLSLLLGLPVSFCWSRFSLQMDYSQAAPPPRDPFANPLAGARPARRALESPEAFLVKRVDNFLAAARSVPPRLKKKLVVTGRATKTEWLNELYRKNIVDASDYSEALSDKLMMAQIFERVLGETHARQYLPKTVGLKQFLERHQLVDSKGRIIADGDKIDASLHLEFPTGFIARPAVGITPYETERGLFDTQEDLISELLKGRSSIYDPVTYYKPIRSSVLDAIVSGEAVVLQENLRTSAELKGKMKQRRPVLVRVHTFENKVIPNSMPRRWVQSDADDQLSDTEIKAATDFAQKFLSELPDELTRRQAWSIEVAAFENGTYRIGNILTNRGKPIAWSSYLDQPRILKAYTQYFEIVEDVEFEGFSARLLRWGLANYFNYWKIRFEKAQGLWKLVAAFPPLP